MNLCNTVFLASVLLFQSAAAVAEDRPFGSDAPLEDLYFSPESVQLTEKEKEAIAIADAWRRGEIMTAKP